MTINIIAVGKLQKKTKDLFDEYKKKILFYSKLNVIEVKEINHPNIEVQKRKETELILKKIPKNSKVFLCSIGGKNLSSVEFSNELQTSNITFIIGGSHGVDETKFKEKITFSKMTFPHQLFRVLLVEQIFRGFSILNNIKYHK